MNFLFLVIVLTVLVCLLSCAWFLGWHLGHRNGSQAAVAFNEHLYRKRMEFETAEYAKREAAQVDAVRAKLRLSVDYERMSAAIKNGNPPSDADLARLGDPQNIEQQHKVVIMPCQDPNKPA